MTDISAIGPKEIIHILIIPGFFRCLLLPKLFHNIRSTVHPPGKVRTKYDALFTLGSREQPIITEKLAIPMPYPECLDNSRGGKATTILKTKS